MRKHETVRPATQRQFKEIAATLIQAIPELDFDEMQGLVRGKREWMSQVRDVLREAAGFSQEFSALAHVTERVLFYRDVFGINKDFSNLSVPEKPEGDYRLLIMAEGMTPNRLFAKCKELFPAWRYTENLDQVVSDRKADRDYAIWVKNGVEPDEELANKSANDLKREEISGIALEERLLYELVYFKETGGHLDIRNVTLCTGSRDPLGGVPRVYWRDDALRVDWCAPGSRRDYVRSRVVVS